MRFKCVTLAIVAAYLLIIPANAQVQPPSEQLLISAKSAYTWTEGDASVIQLNGPVIIELDRARLQARDAVVWLLPTDDQSSGTMRAEIALLGDAQLIQPGATRNGDELMVRAMVRGAIRVTADARLAEDRSDSDLYRSAQRMRLAASQAAATQPVRAAPTTKAATRPAARKTPETQPAGKRFLRFSGEFQTLDTKEGTVAGVFTGGITIIERRPTGDHIELQADRAVVFTPLKSLKELRQTNAIKEIEDALTAVYLEGDVRVVYTPASGSGEQRLRAQHVYYEFPTDRAILTNAVFHTVDPKTQVPIIMRAETIRQLSIGEFRATDVELTTSGFATPSYSINADRIYLRKIDAADDSGEGDRVLFRSSNTTLETFGVPIFYLPHIGGSAEDRATPLRAISIENSSRFGFGVLTEWGLFETLGDPPPRGLDAAYQLDYYSDRGPAGGLSLDYAGGFIDETTKDPWTFNGEFESYFVYDHGFDDVGRLNTRLDEPTELRGQAMWQHQHFFPDDWQMQLRAGYVSDATFLEQWFQNDFDNGLPRDVSAYLKRQRDTEALTLLLQFQPNDLVTTADLLQEQFEVERLPELGYHRIGDSLGEDRFTFFSDNSVAGLHFNQTDATLGEQGFDPPATTPGIPSLGTTGVTNDTVYRGDFRQEINYPLNAGPFRAVPYVIGRLTSYSDTPTDAVKNRAFAGAGARIGTTFWKTDNDVYSKPFDLHRLRHVIEPQLNVYAGAENVDRSDVFIYDEPVDAINDGSAAQIALRQRWQTKRGGPGRWRSVDFFTLNVEGNFFADQPSDAILNPVGFRGLYFPSLPEASIPRNSINSDATWRISDTTAVLADVQYNLDEEVMATAAIGLVVRRGDRVTYFVGNRYIEELDSNITTFSIFYELTRKYSVSFTQSFDFGDEETVGSSAEVMRKFDRFFISVRGGYDQTDDESSFSINIFPTGFGYGLQSDQVGAALAEEGR